MAATANLWRCAQDLIAPLAPRLQYEGARPGALHAHRHSVAVEQAVGLAVLAIVTCSTPSIPGTAHGQLWHGLVLTGSDNGNCQDYSDAKKSSSVKETRVRKVAKPGTPRTTAG